MIEARNSAAYRSWWPAAAMVVLVAAHLLVLARVPLANDATMQWAQITAGRLNDWHPPAMTRLWQALGLFGPGPGPLVVFSALLYWTGFLALAGVFLQARRPMPALATLATGLAAAVLWYEPISKDSLLTAFFVLGYGLALWARQRGRAGPWPLAGASALFVTGVLMRHNGAFAAGPALLFVLAPGLLRRFWLSAGISVAVAALLVPASQLADRHVFGARASHVADALLLFDLTGIAHHSGDMAVFGPAQPIAPQDVARCYSPVMWDTLAPWGRCPWFPAKAGARLLDQPELIAGGVPPPSDYKARWLAAVVRHPAAYLEHRVRHLNAELLLFVSTKPRNGIVPVAPEALDAVEHEAFVLTIARYTAGVIFIPAVVVVGALAAFLILSARMRSPERAGPLLVAAYSMSCSALLYAAAYAVLGVATAPRYYMLTGVLALLALAVALSDAGVRRLLQQRPGLRRLCWALPIAAIMVAELGRIVVPVPPSMPLMAQS